MDGSIIFWSTMNWGTRAFYLAAGKKGLCYLSTPGVDSKEMEIWLRRKYPNSQLVENEEALKPYKDELDAYFNGERMALNLPVAIKGTPFQEAVWYALRDIPAGETASYSEIANQIQNPKAVRAVGAAIGANPILIYVPCHRVIGKNGSLVGFRGGIDMKTDLLALESKLPVK